MAIILWVSLPVIILTFALLPFIGSGSEERAEAAATPAEDFRPVVVEGAQFRDLDAIAKEIEERLGAESEASRAFAERPSVVALWSRR